MFIFWKYITILKSHTYNTHPQIYKAKNWQFIRSIEENSITVDFTILLLVINKLGRQN